MDNVARVNGNVQNLCLFFSNYTFACLCCAVGGLVGTLFLVSTKEGSKKKSKEKTKNKTKRMGKCRVNAHAVSFVFLSNQNVAQARFGWLVGSCFKKKKNGQCVCVCVSIKKRKSRMHTAPSCLFV